MRRSDDLTALHAETGAAWDETAANYERDLAEDTAFLREGGSTLLAPERRILGDLSAWCGRAIHLQCSGGNDALSLLQLGAKEIVGVDISPRMIGVARRKGEALEAPASWVCSDVLETPHELDGTADLVYTGRGALPWIIDINAWAQVVARLLKSGGKLFVFEGHPLDWVWDTNAPEYRLDAAHGDYFSNALNDQRWPMPFLDRQEPPAEAPRSREHQWTLGDDLARRLPHTFSLLMRKP